MPVPLRSVPPESLKGLKLYLPGGDDYSLYCAMGMEFGIGDRNRLLENEVDYVYVSIRDHQQYYRTIEEHLNTIITDHGLQKQKKAEIFYSTSIEIANQLLQYAPGADEIDRVENVSRAMVTMVIEDPDAFGRLFEVSNHDFYTATHMVNVSTYSVSLAQKLGTSDEATLRQIAMGALLHDIGKVFIPSDVLNTMEPLTEEQIKLMRTHVTRGYEHLLDVGNLSEEILNAVLQHHELLDGSGYPRGLLGDEISQIGRLVGIVDAFDAMTSVRPYRQKTFSVSETLKCLIEESGTKLDSEIMCVFCNMIEREIDNTDSVGQKCWEQADRDCDRHLSGRKHKRHYFRISAIVQEVYRSDGKLKLNASLKVIMHNISRSGVGFLSPVPISLDSNVNLSVANTDKTHISNHLAVIVRCQSHDNGWYTIGAQFHQPQSRETIDSIKMSLAIE